MFFVIDLPLLIVRYNQKYSHRLVILKYQKDLILDFHYKAFQMQQKLKGDYLKQYCQNEIA